MSEGTGGIACCPRQRRRDEDTPFAFTGPSPLYPPFPTGRGDERKYFAVARGQKKNFPQKGRRDKRVFCGRGAEKLSQEGNGCKAFSLEGVKNFCSKREKKKFLRGREGVPLLVCFACKIAHSD